MRSALVERATPNGTIPTRRLAPALLAPSALKQRRKAECSPEAQTLGGWQSLEELLDSCGLSKYAKCFQEEEVDLESLNLLSDQDLKSLGLPLDGYIQGQTQTFQGLVASEIQ